MRPSAEIATTHRFIHFADTVGAIGWSLAGNDDLRFAPIGQVSGVCGLSAMVRGHEHVGQFPSSAGAASMATLCSVDAAAWVCWYRDNQSLGATHPAYYDILRTGYGAVRYGGPGS